jgi:hypothetical protein
MTEMIIAMTLNFHLTSSRTSMIRYKLTADGSFTKSNDKEDSTELITPPSLKNSVTTTLNDEVQKQFQFQADYVLPIERSV